MKLLYFPFAGKGEASRCMLGLAGVEFEDVRIPMSQWPAMKASMPFEQVPVLELDDGRRLAQMAAIDRYSASLAGLVPADPWQLAVANMFYSCFDDTLAPLGPLLPMAGKLSDEERAARWSDKVERPFRHRLALLEKQLAARDTKFVAGDELSFADIALFSMLAQFHSGWVKGLPRDILSDYPALKQLRNLVASHPRIAAHYQQRLARAEDAALSDGFLPDAADVPEAAKA